MKSSQTVLHLAVRGGNLALTHLLLRQPGVAPRLVNMKVTSHRAGGTYGAPIGHLWGTSGPVGHLWDVYEAPIGHLWTYRAPMGCLWGVYGAPIGHLWTYRASMGNYGAPIGHLWGTYGPIGHLWAPMGLQMAFWGI